MQYYPGTQFNPYSNQQTTNLPGKFPRTDSREKLNQFTMMQQQHQFGQTNIGPAPAYHRHSLNNLMPMQQTMSLQNNQMNRRNSSNSCGSERVTSVQAFKNPSGTLEGLKKIMIENGLESPKKQASSSASDINSRLESLCRQMTEQAMN